jgi:hypothetical protein
MKHLLFAFLLLFAVSPAQAEKVYKDQEYLDFVASAGAPETVDWAAMRELYVETSFYDPYGGAQSIWYSLQRAGQQMIEEEGGGEALKNYKELLAKHYAHYRAHLQAIDLSGKTGTPHVDRKRHEAAFKGILKSIRATGDGRTPETAFKVIDPAEEHMILKTFHYRFNSQDFRQKDGHFWDVLKYTNPQNETEGEMYFNVDTILRVSSQAKN